jgi:hypothetical protein
MLYIKRSSLLKKKNERKKKITMKPDKTNLIYLKKTYEIYVLIQKKRKKEIEDEKSLVH